ncbi:MAG: aspartate aminotransferase family protein [Alphaproteobacteria bacterium]
MITPLLPVYPRADLAFERGEGARLYTATGEEYLDFGAGIAVNAFGYSHPKLIAALTGQAGKLWHTSNIYRVPGQETLAKKLTEATFADTVFFTNSGVEAIECAIKIARRYQFAKGHSERFRIITFEGAFHGRTLTAIAAGNQAKYLEGFGPKVDGFDNLAFGDLSAVKAAIGPATAGILLEPIQGEGGIRAFPPEFLRALRRLCDENGLVLIFDEIQTGLARTGHLFAYQAAGVAPDVMAIAKALGGGFPVGACLATEAAGAPMIAGTHGSTFGGNPLAMAVANAAFDLANDPRLWAHVREMELRLKQRLAELKDRHPKIIEEVRGAGLLLGLKLKVPNREFAAALREAHLLTVPGGDNTIRLLPPLIIGEAEIAEAMEILDGVARTFRAAEPAKA